MVEGKSTPASFPLISTCTLSCTRPHTKHVHKWIVFFFLSNQLPNKINWKPHVKWNRVSKQEFLSNYGLRSIFSVQHKEEFLMIMFPVLVSAWQCYKTSNPIFISGALALEVIVQQSFGIAEGCRISLGSQR